MAKLIEHSNIYYLADNILIILIESGDFKILIKIALENLLSKTEEDKFQLKMKAHYK